MKGPIRATQPHERRLPAHGDLERGARLDLVIDGEVVVAFAGETVAAALIASGRIAFRRDERLGQPRGLYCGMGVCYECLVTIDGHPNQRACMADVRSGMRIESASAQVVADRSPVASSDRRNGSPPGRIGR